MAENNKETYKNITSNFKKDLECPICLDVVKNPFKMCVRGHLMCVECLNTLIACPTCQGELLVESPVCIKNLLEHLPQYCQFTVNGCKKNFEEGDDSHEKFCGFRQINCRKCDENVIAKNLCDHYQTVHADTYVITEESLDLGIAYSNFSTKKNSPYHNLVFLFGHCFWLCATYCIKKELLEVTFEAIPIGKVEDYYVNVSFINGNFDFRYTLKAFTPEESGQSSQDGIDTNKFRMCVPKEMLSHFIEEGELNITKLFFFKG